MALTRSKATLIFHSKIQVLHGETEAVAIAKLKVWKVPSSEHYPDGRKFSLFLVDRASGEVLIGFDNHKPKGPHIHRDNREEPYEYSGETILIEDFWSLVKEEGFLI